jgi:PAS domain S-box-containing protein
VILITGFDSLNSAIQAVRLGAQDYILKPFDDIESLLVPVKKAVRTHRLEIQNRRLQRELEESEARFRNVLEHAVDLIFQVDVETGRFAYVSPSCEAVLGVPVEELAGLGIPGILELISAEDIQPLLDLDERALHASEIRFRSRTHGLRWLSISASLIRDQETDRPVAVVGTARDVTDVRRMKEQEREYRLALARAERMKSLAVLAGGVAHDLNNILMPILTLPDVMLDDIVAANIPVPETLREDLSVIGHSGERAASVARDLLSLSRCQFLERVPLPINRVVESVLVSGTVSDLQKKNPAVRIERQLSAKDPLVDGSETRLYQALLNLVINAFEAMPQGGTLRVGTELYELDEAISGYERIEPGEYVRVTVTDTGHGISPEIIDRVFEPFHSNKRRSVQSGSGLGLSVVYGVVKGHDGFVDLSSQVDHGTEFRLYFARCRQNQLPPEEEVEAVGGTEGVLLVDDEEIPREMASRMLRQLGYEVTTAENGHEAIEILRQKTVVVGEPSFALVILDMVMEDGFDGLDTYRAIAEFCPAQPCLLISGFSDGDRVREAQRLGAGGFLQKPFSVNQLARKVRVEIDAGT